MPAFPVIFKPPPVLPGRDADKLGENAGVIIRVIKAYAKGNVPDRNVGFHQEIFGRLDAYLVDIGVDVYLDPTFKNMT